MTICHKIKRLGWDRVQGGPVLRGPRERCPRVGRLICRGEARRAEFKRLRASGYVGQIPGAKTMSKVVPGLDQAAFLRVATQRQPSVGFGAVCVVRRPFLIS